MLIVALLLCVLVGVFHYSGLSGLITHFQHLQDLIRQSGMFGYALYILLFIVAALCLIPGSVLVIVGGILFGPVMGTLVSLFAATVASALSFLLARWLGRDLLLKYVGHTTIFQAIEKGIAQSGIDFLIFTRLVPLFPYNIQNYAYGLTTISFWSFTVISAVTTLPGLFIYTLMSHELASEGITLAFVVKLSIAGFILFALVQAAKAWARVKRIVPSANGELADKS
ncbi:TVP38/TMEM64 family protein [Citrobacter sp.]|uniref:TVP38/TMEM64 family protein n=1 Tax=Citrobacter sp. TaxID=1896336 RepID=UPI003FA5D99F